MNLYLISQNVNNGYDTFDSAVVAAVLEQRARETFPSGFYWKLDPDQGCWVDEEGENWQTSWARNVSQVTVKYLGQAAEGTQSGVILASYNAG